MQKRKETFMQEWKIEKDLNFICNILDNIIIIIITNQYAALWLPYVRYVSCDFFGLLHRNNCGMYHKDETSGEE